MGSIKTGLLLYETCLIPALLYNQSTWIKMKKADIERLTKLQNLFLNKLLGVFNCPTPIMHFDLKVTIMPIRILKTKLLFYHHLVTLPDGSLANKIIEILQHLKLYSLKNEIDPFLTRHGVSEVASFSKVQWKHFVDVRISEENRLTLLEQAKGYKKLDSLSLACEEYKLKDYMINQNLAVLTLVRPCFQVTGTT